MKKHPQIAKTTVARRTAIFKTPLGWMGVSATPRGIREVVAPRRRRSQVEEILSVPDFFRLAYAGSAEKVIENHLVQAKAQLMAYCEGRRRVFNLPLDLDQDSEFQKKVWQEALKIPYGETRTYRDIAIGLGRRSLSRAVGTALGANPVPIIVPCHRVVALNGALGGYTGGIEIKRALLRLEGVTIK